MPPRKDSNDRAARNEHVPQDVTDISSADRLLSYALAGQIYPLVKRGITQGKIGQGAGLGKTPSSAGPVLTTALKNGPHGKQLRGLDEIIGALRPELDGLGGLSSLALRLSTEGREKIEQDSLAANIPPGWTRKILTDPPADEVGVLLQASALLSELMAADKMHAADVTASILDRYKGGTDLLVRRLVLISFAPPTSRNHDAQALLGMLASYAFDSMKDRLESHLRNSPMSFRVWRAITKLLKLSDGGHHGEALKFWVRRLVLDSQGLRTRSLYAGRSLDLELAITVPAAWSPPAHDWVGEALLARARDSEATIRERGTASMGLWQRALREGHGLKETEAALRGLISEFRDPDARPDAAGGLKWLAATLEHAIDNHELVCNDWPDIDEPWFRHVRGAADELDNADIPDHLLKGTKNLFRHMILQNADVYRRQAIETVVTSGLNEPVARALGALLKTERTEAWLRVRVEFALGFLQRPDVWAQMDLTGACELAHANLKQDAATGEKPQRAHVTEMHSSLFAIGECFGVAGAEERAKSARDKLRPVLEDLTETEEPRAMILRRPARAAAWMLAATAQRQTGDEPDLSRVLLEKLKDHPDPVTSKFSRWALSFRFAPDGTIRPFLASAEYGEPDDAPY
jgi:hypothetical protein